MVTEGAEPSQRTDEYMSVAAHDLRNPIAVMRASAQMALRQVDRGDLEAAKRRLAAIVEQADRTSDMLEAFLDAARIQSDSLPLRLEVADLGELVRETAEKASRVNGREGRPLEVDAQDGTLVRMDRARVSRAIRALIENAYLYGSSEEPVRVQLSQSDELARLTVSGGGPGPLEEEAARLFERFFRGHAAAEAGHSGSGLGLHTARGITRAHGGDVVRSNSGPPDEFELRLPTQETRD